MIPNITVDEVVLLSLYKYRTEVMWGEKIKRRTTKSSNGVAKSLERLEKQKLVRKIKMKGKGSPQLPRKVFIELTEDGTKISKLLHKIMVIR